MAVATDRFMTADEVMALYGWGPRYLYFMQFQADPPERRFPKPSLGPLKGKGGKGDKRRWRRTLVEDWERRHEQLNGVVA